MSAEDSEKGQRKRQAARTGALARVLHDVMEHRSDGTEEPAPDSGVGHPTVTRDRPVYFPTKGAARIPASACRPWRFADRPESEFEHLESVIQSFKSEGQIQPIVVRPVSDSAAPEIRYEVIVGRVRWQAAMQSGGDIDVVVRDLDDRKAFDVMNAENRERRNLSDYAYARSYAKALEAGLFTSAVELAERVGISKSMMSYYMGFAELDPEVVARLSKPHLISVRLGYALSSAVKAGLKDKVLRDIGKIEAGEIARDDIPTIWEREAVPNPQAVPKSRSRNISAPAHSFSIAGQPVFNAKVSGGGSAVIRFTTKARVGFSEGFWKELEDLVQRYRQI
jgi:ParB/RepB/Spo0J family partition protein